MKVIIGNIKTVNRSVISSRILFESPSVFVTASKADTDVLTMYSGDDGWCIVIGDIPNAEARENSPFRVFCELAQSKKPLGHIKDLHRGVVVAYSRSRNKIFVHRDLTGVYRAYLYSNNEKVIISTSLKELQQELGELPINDEAIALYLSLQYIPQPYTPFKGVSQVISGEFLQFSAVDGQLTGRELLQPWTANESSDEDLACEALRDIFINGFRSQILDSKPGSIGSFLSGGIDSSIVVGTLVRHLGTHPLSMTAAFQEAEYDERSYAEIVRRTYGITGLSLLIGADVLREVKGIAGLFEFPLGDRAVLAQYLLCRQAKKLGITVLCTGEGGDELFGYPRRLSRDNLALLRGFSKGDLARFYNERSALWRERADVGSQFLEELYCSLPEGLPLNTITFGQWRTWLTDNIAVKDKSIADHFGMRYISPFLNGQLMSLVAALPNKEHLLYEKALLKEAFSDVLPLEVLLKPKHRFELPLAEWLRKDPSTSTLFHDVLCRPNAFVLRYVNRSDIERMLNEHQSGDRDWNRVLYALFFLESWYEVQHQPSEQEEPAPVTMLESKVVTENPWTTVYRDRIQFVNGHVREYLYVTRAENALIIPLIRSQGEMHTLLVRQYRHPVRKALWQFPMGGVNADTPFWTEALRELEEETGFRAHHVTFLGEFFIDPGLSTQKTKVIICEVEEKGSSQFLEESEVGLSFQRFSLPEVRTMVSNGSLCDSFTLVAVMLLEQYLAFL